MRFSLSLIFVVIYVAGASKTCKDLLRELADNQSKFVSKVTHFAVPVQICENSRSEYINMAQSFNLLFANCSDIYFDKDRLNVVYTLHSSLNELWQNAFCDDCFSSNVFENFTNKLSTLQKCFSENHNFECTACVLQYEDLNTFYINLDQLKNGNICFDMKDSMNRTRSDWSTKYKCCKRQFDAIFFILNATLIAALSLAFYIGVYVWTKRLERNHGILNNIDPELNAPPASVPVATSPTIVENILDSTMPQNNMNSKRLDDDSDSTDSDAPLTAKNKNL